MIDTETLQQRAEDLFFELEPELMAQGRIGKFAVIGRLPDGSLALLDICNEGKTEQYDNSTHTIKMIGT